MEYKLWNSREVYYFENNGFTRGLHLAQKDVRMIRASNFSNTSIEILKCLTL